PGQLVENDDILGHLIARHIHPAVGDDRLRNRLRIIPSSFRPQHHVRTRPLAPFLVRNANYRTIGNVRVTDDALLHLDRGNILPAADHHILGPIQQLNITIGVLDTEIAGVEIPTPEGDAGGFLILEISRHHPIASHDYFAHRRTVTRHLDNRIIIFSGLLDDQYLFVGDHCNALPSLENRTTPDSHIRPLALWLADGIRPIGFRQPINVRDFDAEILTPSDDGGARRGSRGHDPEVLHAPLVLIIDQRGEHRGSATHVSDPLFCDQAPHLWPSHRPERYLGCRNCHRRPAGTPARAVKHGQRP